MTLPAKNPFPYADSIAVQVRDEKQRRDLSDRKLAKAAGVSRRHLVELQKGANVTLLIAEKVMEALELEELVFPGGNRRLAMTARQVDSAVRRQQQVDLEAVGHIEAGVALILHGASVLRQSHSEEPAATVKPELAAKAANLIADFGKYVRKLSSEEQMDALQGLFSEASLTAPSPTPAKKRRVKRLHEG